MAVTNLSYGLPNEYGILRQEVWSKKFTYRLMERTSMMETCNSAYEGDLKKGYEVHIPRVPTVPWTTMVEGQPFDHVPLGFTEDIFKINRAWGSAFSVTDWAELQSLAPKAPALLKQQVENGRVKVETDFLADIYSHAGTGNYGLTAGIKTANINLGTSGTPLIITTPSDALAFVQAVWLVMQQQNVPDGDSVALYMPDELYLKLVNSDLKAAYLTGESTSTLVSGKLPKIMGGKIAPYTSNLLTTVTDTSLTYELPFYHKEGVSFAIQGQKSRVLPDPKFPRLNYDTQIIGDWAAVRPELLGWAHVQVVI